MELIKHVIASRRLQNPTIPPKFRTNLIHLSFDMIWFGVLSGSAINFLSIYASRLGANGFQIGLLGATPAVVNLLFAMPAGQLLERRPVGKAVFWFSVIYRLGYLLWIPMPWLFDRPGQIWALIGLALLMGVPLTIFTVGFNVLFAVAVPDDWRAYTAGLRNAVYSITYMLASLGSGWLLIRLPFTLGYQIVFGIGGLSALLSSVHLFFIRTQPILTTIPETRDPQPMHISEDPKEFPSWRNILRTDIWRTPFATVLLVMLGFHLTQYLPIPLVSLYSVDTMHLTDQNIGNGTALYYLTFLIGSTQLYRISRWLGHHKATGIGFILVSLYPFLLGLSHSSTAYYIISAIGGISWSLAGGAYTNYILENIPSHDRPAYLAWYNIVLNASILTGSLVGPLIARFIGLGMALVLFGVIRLMVGIAILKWGQARHKAAELATIG